MTHVIPTGAGFVGGPGVICANTVFAGYVFAGRHTKEIFPVLERQAGKYV